MLIPLIVVALVSQFIVYEIFLQLAAIFAPRRFIPYTEALQRRSVRKIFSTFSCYGGFRPILENRLDGPLPERFVLVANHQSLIDIPVVWRLLPGLRSIRFIAKRELGFGIPFVSSLLRHQGHALVARKGNFVQSVKSLERFARRSRREGFCPVIFPEGTRSRTGELGVFHTAGYRMMMEAEALPVLVAAIDGGSHVASLKGFFRNLGRFPYTVRLVAVLPPPHGKKEILASLGRSRDLVAAALEDMRRNGSLGLPALGSPPR